MSVEVSPIAVGGIGGSGTRLIAAMFARASGYIGSDLNESLDNLWFTLLFKRMQVMQSVALQRRALRIFFAAMRGRTLDHSERQWLMQLAHWPCAEFDAGWAAQRVASLLHACESQVPEQRVLWGWKEPNTHLYLETFLREVPGFRYIHVMRHGLDMAFSRNQTQLRLWGAYVLNDGSAEICPERALRYWITVHERIARLANAWPEQVMLLNYDDLCRDAHTGVKNIEAFLQWSLTDTVRNELVAMPRVTTAGRYRGYDLRGFESGDIARVAAFGFEVE